MTRPLVVIGDALLDRDLDGTAERLCPDAPVPIVDDPVCHARPGGAGLAATLAAAGHHDVVLVTALAGDAAGRELDSLLRERGVEVLPVPLGGATPEKVRVRVDGRPLLRLDHAAQPSTPGQLSREGRAAIIAAGAVLVSDYGRGLTSEPTVRQALGALDPKVPIVWDPHPRGAQPVRGVRLATPNRSEAAALAGHVDGMADDSPAVVVATALASELVRRWHARSIAVTLGDKGAVLVGPDGPPMALPAPSTSGGDPCGAGDRFASAATAALLDGALTSEAVIEAVAAASAFVAAGGAGGLERSGDVGVGAARPGEGPIEVAARVRSAGGTVVATGGCFDLLHAGHVGMLRAARQLGDCLVVCLNSDASVRRLKGPDRPLQRVEDRTAVLEALDCVDAVAIFDDDTPVPLLERIRPHIFAKGGDYAVADLPEGRALAGWGGQAVVLPYLVGRSTTALIDLAGHQPNMRRGEPRAR